MLIQNAILIREDGVILKSTHRHDCVVHETPTGKRWMLDGGTDYQRASFSTGGDYDDLTITDNSSTDEVDRRLAWRTYGKDGHADGRWVLLIQCDDDHLKAILAIPSLGRLYRESITRILNRRIFCDHHWTRDPFLGRFICDKCGSDDDKEWRK